jgi:hypothetical protein
MSGTGAVMVIEAVPPGMVGKLDVTELIVLVCRPGAVPVTLMKNVHTTPLARVGTVAATDEVPATAVTTAPGQPAVDSPFGVEMTRPAGRGR